MTSATPCPLCNCVAGATATHVIAAALAMNDIDRALDAGLLADAGCTGCSPACAHARAIARQARITALSARERYRQRTARLERRSAERAARRATTAAPKGTGDAVSSIKPGLPPAAAAALARAKAKAAERKKA